MLIGCHLSRHRGSLALGRETPAERNDGYAREIAPLRGLRA